MKIYIIRHAAAEERELFSKQNKDDDLRPLTKEGKREFQKVSKKIRKSFPKMDGFYSSPLLRATQTADILSKVYNKKYKIIEELRPNKSITELLLFLQKEKKENIFIVGHEPFLSRFICQITANTPFTFLEMKKGGICMVEAETMGKKFIIKALFSAKQILRMG